MLVASGSWDRPAAVRPEGRAPEARADDRAGASAGCLFRLREKAAARGRDAQHVEIIVRDARTPDALVRASDAQRERDRFLDYNAFKHAGQPAHVGVVAV